MFGAVFTVVQLEDPDEEAKAIAAEEKEEEEAHARKEAEAEAVAEAEEEEKQRRAQSPEAFSERHAAPGNQVCSDHLLNAGCAGASDTKTVYAHVCCRSLVFVLTVACAPLQTQSLQAGAGRHDAVQPSTGDTKLVKKVFNMVLQLKHQHLCLLTPVLLRGHQACQMTLQ